MRTEDLRVQALKNPLGINENPVFSWQLVSDKKDEKNERQTAYRILVSESEASLINETGMLWDSGVVKESRCFGILYQGKKATFCTESVLEGDGVGWRKSGIRVE